ncbi:MAG: hypothetical protein HOD63_06050 [Bacteroidetes bacterium]|nr:hypothetical protein [Bacteroidota bacterium]
MKPYKILIFMSIVLVLLLILASVFPEKGLPLGKEYKLKFLTLNQILNPEKVEYADISALINTPISDTLITESIPTDSIDPYSHAIDTMLTQEMRALLHRLQFPANDRSVLYPFLIQLRKLQADKKLIRIIHYGDSQLEGDRITSYIRYRLQSKFGGGGSGMLAVKDIVHTASVHRDVSNNWKRYTVFGRRDTNVIGNVYGPMLSFSRFAPFEKDSIQNDSIDYESWIKLSPSNLTYALTRNYTQFKLLYNNNKSGVSIKLEDKEGEIIIKDSLPPTTSVKYLSWDIADNTKPLFIRMKGKDSPDIYAMSLDKTHGIIVDNVAMRGSSGVDFNRTSLSAMSRFFKEMNVKLLLLEYGVNVVPNVLEDYGFYENWFYKNLKSLKKLDPDLCIIVIGISDMSRKREVGDGYESYPNIEKIRNAQKNAAFRSGCAFWDMFEAMGGKNSMPSWVMAEPSLAQKDFTHFNPAGARIIGEMFYDALITEYDDYVRQHPEQTKTKVQTDSLNNKKVQKIEIKN